MKPYYEAEAVTLYLGDCIEVMRQMPEASVDAVVCDPPYGLEFMGKAWDRHESPHAFQQWCEAWACEAYRVLKPGGMIASFGGMRTHHRMVSGIEDAGFEIRDSLCWIFGSGFPKSLNVSAALRGLPACTCDVLDESGAVSPGSPFRPVGAGVGAVQRADSDFHNLKCSRCGGVRRENIPDGLGTTLKPAVEYICLARKPLGGTVAANVLAHGTGALNIDASRIGTTKRVPGSTSREHDWLNRRFKAQTGEESGHDPNVGRWPANVLLDEEAAALLDATVGELTSGKMMPAHTDAVRNTYGQNAAGGYTTMETYGDRDGPSRFFYTAKSSRSEREAGLEALPGKTPGEMTDRKDGAAGANNPRAGAGRGQDGVVALRDGGRGSERHNSHPTVKPVSLMRWLCTLVTPPGGTILDPFLGSGSTCLGALDAGFRFVGIEQDEHYLDTARTRITHRHLLEVETRESNEDIPQGRLM